MRNSLFKAALCCALAVLAPFQAAAKPADKAAEPAAARISGTAQRLYEQSRSRLLQIRILLKNRGAQTSAGSGFLVSADGLVVTNYHVVSQLALEPDKHRAEFSGADGRAGSLTLLAIDVRQDLAVLHMDQPGAANLSHFAWAASEPHQGDRLYSLGNPLDIGFAVVEGIFNGYPQRGFYPRMLFTGAINPGMSGGPVLNATGEVVGVNVAKHMGGELVSFLVPVRYARALAAGASKRRPLVLPAHAEVTRQLLAHQQDLTARILARPLRQQAHGRYRVPLLDEALARCWGDASTPGQQLLGIERSDCSMETAIFTGLGSVGSLSLRHEAYDGTRLGTLRFYRQFSGSLANEFYRPDSSNMTALECSEDFVDQRGLPLRAVFCARAHRKFPGLYDVSLLAMSLNENQRGVQGRMDATGVSFDNGLRLARHYMEGLAWVR